jgi:DNA-binding transcriptional LysR family regulator
VALTDEGEMLLGDARRLLQFEEAARHRLAAPQVSGTVRLGVVEEVASGSLPSALGRFAKLHPGVKLEVQIGVSAELIEQLNAGRLDVVFAKRPLGTSKGRLVWREPLVWAAAETFDLVPGGALPLALYRERSVCREAALAALRSGSTLPVRQTWWNACFCAHSFRSGNRPGMAAKSPIAGFQRATIVAAAACVNTSSAALKAATASSSFPAEVFQTGGPRTSWPMPDIHEHIAERFAVRLPSAPPPGPRKLGGFPGLTWSTTFPSLLTKMISLPNAGR